MTTKSQPTTVKEQTTNNVTSERLSRLRSLNDRLRVSGRGGIVQMTRGVACLPPSEVFAIFEGIAAFEDFTKDNDPWGEHDCAVQTIGGHRVIWKIDYFDRSRTFHSPDPSNPKVTVRILTVMLAEEY